ncbi:MAG: hypothetical protein KKA84_14685 [Bacteroidetes bacterium]|nr:hypothetical protein [Bacteroidota bacterium]
MLNKISNINNGVDFRKSKKFNQYKRNGDSSYSSRENEHDTIKISPALNFFDNSSWRLRNITESSDERIIISFEINDYELNVAIDSSTLHQVSFLKFSAGKIVNGNFRNKKIQIDILVELTRFYRINNYDNLGMLDLLFERSLNLNFNGELTKNDKILIKEISGDIITGLQKEFEAISCGVLSFIESYTGKKVDLRKHDPPLMDNHLVIDKIKMLDG